MTRENIFITLWQRYTQQNTQSFNHEINDTLNRRNAVLQNDTIKRMKRQAADRGRMFVRHTPDDGLTAECKELPHLLKKKACSLIEKQTKDLNWRCKENQIIHFLNHRENENDMTKWYYRISTRMSENKKANTVFWQRCRWTGTLAPCWCGSPG